MSCDDNVFCLRRELVDSEYHEPYIYTGYRKPEMSFMDSLKSIFLPYCNEFFNVWSHGLFGIYFCAKYWKVFTDEFDMMDPLVWPLFTFAIGMIGFCFMSSSAHTFNSMSKYCRCKCFYLDYAAISIYGLGVNQAFYFYARPIDTSILLFKSPELFLTISLLNSLIGTFLCCMSLTRWRRFQYLIRTFAYTSSFIFGSLPLIYRFSFCTTRVDCDYRGFPLYCKQTMFLLIAAIAYVTKLPERFAKGKFDCVGSSHNIMHVFTAIGASIKFEFVKTELINRKENLINDEIYPTIYTSLLLMIVGSVLNLTICYLVKPGTNKPYNKDKKKE